MSGRNAFGTRFQRGDDAGTSFQTIANVTSISGPSRTRETIDVTAHDSADGYMEYLGGLRDGGEVTLDLNYDPDETTHTVLDTDFDADDNPREYRVVLNPDQDDEYTWNFSAIITDLSDEFPYDDKMSRSATFKITGKPTLAETSSS